MIARREAFCASGLLRSCAAGQSNPSKVVSHTPRTSALGCADTNAGNAAEKIIIDSICGSNRQIRRTAGFIYCLCVTVIVRIPSLASESLWFFTIALRADCAIDFEFGSSSYALPRRSEALLTLSLLK